jgi:drug/metabolite transporter (DMT)-like permease
LEDRIIYILITIIICFFGAIAALIFKKSSSKIKISTIKETIISTWKSKILIGIIIYGITAIFSIYLLSKLDVTLFYPLTSITYIFSFILAKKYLNEEITKFKILGIILIILGVILVV